MNKQIIKYNIEDFNKIACMDDFYKIINLDFVKIKNVSQIHMNKDNCEKLNDFIKLNARKDKRFKHLKTASEKYYNNACGMDWLNYSPVSKEDMPIDEIWVYEEDNNEF